MPMFYDKWSKRLRVVQCYDNEMFVVTNSSSTSEKKEFQDLKPNNILTSGGWNNNHFSTKKDVYRDYTIVNPKLLKGDQNKYNGYKRSSMNY